MHSNSALQQTSSRIRHGEALPSDEDGILSYRNFCSPVLVDACSLTHATIADSNVPAEFAARLKRYNSIVRKIIREKTHPGRMDDIVGVRVLVRDREHQERVSRKFSSISQAKRPPRDYVSSPAASGYRAIHHFLDVPHPDGRIIRVEVQLRTYLQHLWASLSESFGSQVKEGGGPVDIRDYLSSVGEELSAIDESGSSSSMLPLLPVGDRAAEFVVLAFAVKSRMLSNEFRVGTDIARAVKEFSVLEGRNELDVETVLLFCREISSLRRTHIAYFPASLVADLLDVARLSLPDWVVHRLLMPKSFAIA